MSAAGIFPAASLIASLGLNISVLSKRVSFKPEWHQGYWWWLNYVYVVCVCYLSGFIALLCVGDCLETDGVFVSDWSSWINLFDSQ